MQPNQMQRVKKQHYVPKCYLRSFSSDQSDHLFVYDKTTQKSWNGAISDIAEEGYFYDLSFPDSLDTETQTFLQDHNVTLKQLKADQTIEKYLANTVENRYKHLLSSLVSSFRQLSPWVEKNCFFISKKDKEELSYYIAIQMLRTRALRDSILGSADRLQQVLLDMGVNNDVVNNYSLTEKQAGNIQGRMLLDEKKTMESAMLLNHLTWILYINRTPQLLYTSDSPVARIAHAKHAFLSMAGLSSPGVELSIPISPQLILIMIEGHYHKLSASLDRTWQEMKPQNVQHYNARCIYQSHRFVFSSNNDFKFLADLAKNGPQVFMNGMQDVTLWGGKTYRTRKF